MKKQLVLFIHLIITVSIIHTPLVIHYPSSFAMSHAARESNYRSPISGLISEKRTYDYCKKENLYHPECVFQDEVSLVDQLNSEWYDSLFTFLISLSFLNMQLYQRLPRDVRDCPDNTSSNLSWYSAKMGSLLHVVSEYRNNNAYRSIASEASKLQDSDLDSLISIYQKQKDVAQTKLTISNLLKTAYLSSEATEVANIKSCQSKCKVGHSKASATFIAAKDKLRENHHVFKDSGLKFVLAKSGHATKTTQYACGQLEKSISALNIFYDKTHKTLNSMATKEFNRDVTNEKNKQDTVVNSWMSFVPANAVINLISIESEAQAEITKNYKKARANTAFSSKLRVKANSLMAKVEYTSKECLKAIEKDARLCQKSNMSSCEQWKNKAQKISVSVARTIKKQHSDIQTAFKMPVLCCGSEGKIAAKPSLDTLMPHLPGTYLQSSDRTTLNFSNPAKRSSDITNRNDIFYTNLVNKDVARKIVSKIEQGDFKHILEKFIYNLYVQQIFKMIQKRNIEDLNYERNLLAFHLNELNKKMHAQRMLKFNKKQLAALEVAFDKALEKLLPNAHANFFGSNYFNQSFFPMNNFSGGLGGIWGGLFMPSIPSVNLFMGVNDFMGNALQSPARRLWTWDSMIEQTNLLISKNSETLSDLNERIQTIREKKYRVKNISSKRPRKKTKTKTKTKTKIQKTAIPTSKLASTPKLKLEVTPLKASLAKSHLQGIETLEKTVVEVASTGEITPEMQQVETLETIVQNNNQMQVDTNKMRSESTTNLQEIKEEAQVVSQERSQLIASAIVEASQPKTEQLEVEVAETEEPEEPEEPEVEVAETEQLEFEDAEIKVPEMKIAETVILETDEPEQPEVEVTEIEVSESEVTEKEEPEVNKLLRETVADITETVDALACETSNQTPSEKEVLTRLCNPEFDDRCNEQREKDREKESEDENVVTADLKQQLFDKFKRMGGDPTALEQALCFLNKNKNKRFKAKDARGYPKGISISNQRYITINDLTKNSKDLRFFVIDLQEGKINAYKSAHGVGKGKTKNSWYKAKYTSNKNKSHLTPRGFFLTGNRYTPSAKRKWRMGMRLHGLQVGVNDLSYKRGIVMHPTGYVPATTLSDDQLGDQNLSKMSAKDKRKLLGKRFKAPAKRTYGCTGLGSTEIFKEVFNKIGAGIEHRRTQRYKDEDGNTVLAYPDNHSLYYNYSTVEAKKGNTYCGDAPSEPLLEFD